LFFSLLIAFSLRLVRTTDNHINLTIDLSFKPSKGQRAHEIFLLVEDQSGAGKCDLFPHGLVGIRLITLQKISEAVAFAQVGEYDLICSNSCCPTRDGAQLSQAATGAREKLGHPVIVFDSAQSGFRSN